MGASGSSMAADGRAGPAATDRGVKQGRDEPADQLLESSPPDHAVSYCACGDVGYNGDIQHN